MFVSRFQSSEDDVAFLADHTGTSPRTKTFTPMLEFKTVTRLDYGYDYIGVWTPPMAGLSRKKNV